MQTTKNEQVFHTFENGNNFIRAEILSSPVSSDGFSRPRLYDKFFVKGSEDAVHFPKDGESENSFEAIPYADNKYVLLVQKDSDSVCAYVFDENGKRHGEYVTIGEEAQYSYDSDNKKVVITSIDEDGKTKEESLTLMDDGEIDHEIANGYVKKAKDDNHICFGA